MKFSKIIFEKNNKVGKITLNRPEVLNCYDTDTLLEIEAALKEIEQDENIRVAMITGKGKFFCTGHDLKEIQKMPRESDYFYEHLILVRRVYSEIEELSKPVIAVVNGLALAGGLELVMSCDLAIASEEARLGDQHINYGLLGLANQMLPRLVGLRKAKELIFTGDWLSAIEAQKIGLVNMVVPADKLEEAANELAAKLASKSPMAIKLAKGLINQGMQTDRRTAYQFELETVARYGLISKDLAEGLKTFGERKKKG